MTGLGPLGDLYAHLPWTGARILGESRSRDRPGRRSHGAWVYPGGQAGAEGRALGEYHYRRAEPDMRATVLGRRTAVCHDVDE